MSEPKTVAANIDAAHAAFRKDHPSWADEADRGDHECKMDRNAFTRGYLAALATARAEGAEEMRERCAAAVEIAGQTCRLRDIAADIRSLPSEPAAERKA